MKYLIEFGDLNLLADLNKRYDISIPINDSENQVNCFYAPFFSIEPVRMGGFIGSVKEGGPVNFTNVRYNVHGNGTHTECYGHISEKKLFIHEVCDGYFGTALLVSIYPTQHENGDRIIERITLEQMLDEQCPKALIIRTLPNEDTKKNKKYSGSNPVYISKQAMEFITSKGIEHLLVDIPSVDREEDGGLLLAHREFWKDDRAKTCTITELVYVPTEINDGKYFLLLQIAPFLLDAAPSRPILCPLVDKNKL